MLLHRGRGTIVFRMWFLLLCCTLLFSIKIFFDKRRNAQKFPPGECKNCIIYWIQVGLSFSFHELDCRSSRNSNSGTHIGDKAFGERNEISRTYVAKIVRIVWTNSGSQNGPIEVHDHHFGKRSHHENDGSTRIRWEVRRIFVQTSNFGAEAWDFIHRWSNLAAAEKVKTKFSDTK